MIERAPQVFISHADEDRPFVEREILPVLRSRGIAFWYSPHDLRVGEYPEAIRHALEMCPYLIVVASRAAVASKWVRAEVHWVVEKRSDPKKILVVCAETCPVDEINFQLLSLQRANFAEDGRRAADLLEAWSAAITAAPSDQLILSVIGSRGGVGKSTIACRMAEMIAETGHNVLLVDLDTSAAGITHLFLARGSNTSSTVSTYQIMDWAAQGRAISRDASLVMDVTAGYLARQEGAGRVFLLPAVPQQNAGRPMLEILIQLHSAKGAGIFQTILADTLSRAAEDARAPIHCIVMDCGAQGQEFDPLVTSALELSRMTYVVVQPDQSSPDSLVRIKHLASSQGGPQAPAKLRVVINRVFSPQHEPVARAAFMTSTIAGTIFDDKEYFSAIQLGRVNLEDYDTISRGVREVLSYRRELPSAMVPTEDDLWARKVARILSDAKIGGLKPLIERMSGRGLFLIGLIELFVGLLGAAGLVLAMLRQFNLARFSRALGWLPLPAHWILALLATSAGLALYLGTRRRQRQTLRDLRMFDEIDNIVTSSPRPYRHLLDYIRKLAQTPNDPRLTWLRVMVRPRIAETGASK